MQNSSQPKLIPIPFADNGSKQDIPNASQVGITAGRASYTDGFPPLTRTPLAAGGVPPFGTDFNGVFNDITAALRWSQSGSGYPFNAAFNMAISGYPKGAKIPNSTLDGYWLNTIDGNTANPEVTGAATTGWVPAENYGVTAITGLSGSSVTLTTLQAAKERISLAGTLTANINLVVPAWRKKWVISNSTTGKFSVTIKTPNGNGVAIPAGMVASVLGDGTNIVIDNQTLNISTQVTGVIGQSRNLSMVISTAAALATITADEIIVGTALGGSQYRIGNFTNTINLATTGAGGMDTGTVPSNGFVGIYAIYNPATGASSLLAVNASSLVSEVYSGGNMPSGYTASALLTVVPVSGSQFKPMIVTGRKVAIPVITLISTSSVLSASQVTITGAAPLNAISIDGGVIVSSTAAGSMVINVLPSTSTMGVKSFTGYAPANTGISSSYNNLMISARGSVYITTSHSTSGTPTFTVNCMGYEI